MKIQIKILLGVGVVTAGSSLWFTLSPSMPIDAAAVEAFQIRQTREELAEPPAAAAEEVPNEGQSLEIPVSIAEWQAAYSRHLAGGRSPEEAGALLKAELDEKYHEWVLARLEALAEVSADDRYEKLAEMERRIQAVSEAILGRLGIAGAQQLGALARSHEAVVAEIQYAEMSGTHEARVAMLRLDREREDRFEKLIAARGNGPETEELVQSEITPWYESRLREIVGGEEPE